MLCSVYGARDSKKNRNKCGWKMAMPFNYISKEKSYSIQDVMFVNGDCT